MVLLLSLLVPRSWNDKMGSLHRDARRAPVTQRSESNRLQILSDTDIESSSVGFVRLGQQLMYPVFTCWLHNNRKSHSAHFEAV